MSLAIYQAFQKRLKCLALAGGIVALSGCDTPEVRVLYRAPEGAECSVQLEHKVKKAAHDHCRLEVAYADGKTLLVLDRHCNEIDGLRINDPSGKSYTLETLTFGDHYMMESKPSEPSE